MVFLLQFLFKPLFFQRPIMLVQGQLKMDEAKYPIEYFKVFSQI